VRSRRPFDFTDRHIAGSVWALHTKQTGEITPNFSLLYSDHAGEVEGELELLVSISRTELCFDSGN